ncbi:signal peptidase I [Acidicapsa ligni]|uniref:signal peptidase I n=1 Tax=Acidicapsa ligni TaxID=542300 RepID=UPI00295BC8FA|nr:signal peptidase I [Acidicapsa ligni]
MNDEPQAGPAQQLSDSHDGHPANLPSPNPPSRVSGWKLWMRDLLISSAASVMIITFLYQPVRVEGTSMLPRLVDQDRLFINKFVYHFEAIEHGDVVVFRYPRDLSKSYIKRVIAVSGDRLSIDRGQVYVNDKLLSEPYVPEEFHDNRSLDPMIVPAGEYFVMGDHRSISSDSREFGPVRKDLIYGKAEFVYWPRQDVGVVH